MKREKVDLLLGQIEEELRNYYNTFRANSSFQFYKQIDFGYKSIGLDDYIFHFDLFTDSKNIRHKAEAIIEKLNIPREEVYFNRVLQKKYRPNFLSSISIGSSIGAKRNIFGSLGLFVENENLEKGFISCGHVLPEKNGEIGSKVYTPGVKLFKSKTKVGTVLESYSPKRKIINEIDAAFAKIDPSLEHNISNILTIDKFKGKKLHLLPHGLELEKDEVIYKIGAKSLLKSGINGGFGLEIDVKENYKFQEVLFIDEISQPLAINGDSGGPAFVERDNELFCIGIVMAKRYLRVGKSKYTQMQVVVCPISKIFSKLKLKHI